MVKDFRGTEYGVGSTIVYAKKNYGSAVYLREAVVLEVKSRQVPIGHNEYTFELDGQSVQTKLWYDVPEHIRKSYAYHYVWVTDGERTEYSLRAKPVDGGKAVSLTSLYHVVAIPDTVSAA